MCVRRAGQRRRKGQRALGGAPGGEGEAKPRNPRHFAGIEGGRKRDSDTFTQKAWFMYTYRGAQPLFHALFWRQNTV